MATKMEEFAFRHVPIAAQQEMADILDPPSSFGLSWKNFAEKLNGYLSPGLRFNPIKIEAIASRHTSPTMEIFRIISRCNNITINIVQEVLIDMSSVAADVLPRYINVIAKSALNDLCDISKPGHHHSCHCDSCINYCDCHTHDNQLTHFDNGHCRLRCQHDFRDKSEHFHNHDTVSQINRTHCIKSMRPHMFDNQQLHTKRCNFRGTVQIRQQHCRNDVFTDNNLDQLRTPDISRRNVTVCPNIEQAEILRRSGQHISSYVTTSKNPSESVHHFEHDSAIIQSQNQIFNQCQQQSKNLPELTLDRGTGYRNEPINDWIPPDVDEESDDDEVKPLHVNLGKNLDQNENNHDNINWSPPDDIESDCDVSIKEISSEQSRIGMSQSELYRKANRPQDQSQSRSDNIQLNGNMQSEENRNIQSQPQFVSTRQNIVKTKSVHSQRTTANAQINLQCTCLHEEHRLSLPVMRSPRPEIRKKCASESDTDRKTGGRQSEDSSCTCKKKLKIFTSFAVGNTNHLREILKLQKAIGDTGKYVLRSDMNEEAFHKKMTNSHDWLEEEFRNADYVIFCISPEFYEYIQPDFKENCVAYPTNARLHTRFIFDLARTEYVNNGSKNERFLPVVFTNSGANDNHVPQFMRATIIYHYPRTFESLLSFLDSNPH